jgi:hypothetical protein
MSKEQTRSSAELFEQLGLIVSELTERQSNTPLIEAALYMQNNKAAAWEAHTVMVSALKDNGMDNRRAHHTAARIMHALFGVWTMREEAARPETIQSKASEAQARLDEQAEKERFTRSSPHEERVYAHRGHIRNLAAAKGEHAPVLAALARQFSNGMADRLTAGHGDSEGAHVDCTFNVDHKALEIVSVSTLVLSLKPGHLIPIETEDVYFRSPEVGSEGFAEAVIADMTRDHGAAVGRCMRKSFNECIAQLDVMREKLEDQQVDALCGRVRFGHFGACAHSHTKAIDPQLNDGCIVRCTDCGATAASPGRWR